MALLLGLIDAALECYHQFAELFLLPWVALRSIMINRQSFLDLLIIKWQIKGLTTIPIHTIPLLLVHIDLLVLHGSKISQPIQISKRYRFIIPTIHDLDLRCLAIYQVVLEPNQRSDDCECFAALNGNVDGIGGSPKLYPCDAVGFAAEEGEIIDG